MRAPDPIALSVGRLLVGMVSQEMVLHTVFANKHLPPIAALLRLSVRAVRQEISLRTGKRHKAVLTVRDSDAIFSAFATCYQHCISAVAMVTREGRGGAGRGGLGWNAFVAAAFLLLPVNTSFLFFPTAVNFSLLG